ncbi:MAG: hypothetical protein KDK39_07265, partial [Leptospiraceae bacterium]|nr:hypothetical protein [Leptospiraceae bacterium]
MSTPATIPDEKSEQPDPLNQATDQTAAKAAAGLAPETDPQTAVSESPLEELSFDDHPAPESVSNPHFVVVDGKVRRFSEFVAEYDQLCKQGKLHGKARRKAQRKYSEEKSLMPFQAELIQLQQYLEDNQRRMIILFEG